MSIELNTERNIEQNIGTHDHNRKTDEEEVEKIKAELEIATERIAYFENIIKSADDLRKLAEVKIIETESKKLDTIPTNWIHKFRVSENW